jgi:DNA-directed RNA polymerase II subunit RPB2
MANTSYTQKAMASLGANNEKTMKNELNYKNFSELAWSVINLYFKEDYLKQLVRHQIESYNYFMNYQIQETINMFNPIVIEYEEKLEPWSKIKVYITFNNFKLYQPQIFENNGSSKIMFPNEARLRNFTYASNMTLDLDIKYEIINEKKGTNETIMNSLNGISIGKMPIMLKSDICVLKQYSHVTKTDECDFDTGGYFIINGSEKTVLSQERAAENIIYCFNVEKNSNKWAWTTEVRSVPDNKQISPKLFSIHMMSKSNENGHCMYAQLPKLKKPVPLFILFRALGIISDKRICEYILLNCDFERMDEEKEKMDMLQNMLYMLKASIIESNSIKTQEEAFEYIMKQVMYNPYNQVSQADGQKKKREYTETAIHDDFLPHCETKQQKLYFIGCMVYKLFKTKMGIIKESDRDSHINKRIDTTGFLLNNLFRNYFNKMVKDMQKQIKKELACGSWRSDDDYKNIINMTNIYKIVKSSTIENGIKRALATGDFGLKNIKSNKVGVAQVLNRLTYISTLSHLRRVNTPIDKSGKLIPPRKLHNTIWGFLCPAETPEGHSVGIVKNLSYMTTITLPSNSEPICDYIEPFLIKLDEVSNPYQLFGKVKVFVNGCWKGVTDNPLELYEELRRKKEFGIINIYTSIVFDYFEMEIHVLNGAGRFVRPVLRVKNNKLVLEEIVKNNKLFLGKNVVPRWNDLLVSHEFDAAIEYIDPFEQNSALVAMKPHELLESGLAKYSHCEIHPSSIFGILASCIPFPQHNQSPRNVYQCAMGKQAMGVYTTNFDKRMDKTAFVLTYSHRPLVDTRVMDYIKLHKIPNGTPVIVAIMSHSGYNQEDSILFNQGSIDRGLFQATIYHTEKDEDKKLHGDSEIRCRPDPKKTKGMKFGNYDKIDSRGVIPEDTIVNDKDIIISKIVPIKENRNDHTKVIKYEDHSRIYRTDEEVYVDKNMLNKNGDGYNICKVKLRALRPPRIGDKFSSRHGQKGTIGNVIPEKDMPYTQNGIKPDIIINPHAIPSRMTIAQLKETLMGKILVELGLFGDGTSFEDFSVEFLRKELLKLNYESSGNELLYNGLTGEQLETSIFIGPCFYQRLKHMVIDKQHSRSIGPMVNLTRQPAEGRSRDGGLRFGEMERDCMVSHGASRFTKERIYDVSDKFVVHACNDCGKIAAYNAKKGIYKCNMCDNMTNFSEVQLPYSCKLLFQELITMNVMPRIITQ